MKKVIKYITSALLSSTLIFASSNAFAGYKYPVNLTEIYVTPTGHLQVKAIHSSSPTTVLNPAGCINSSPFYFKDDKSGRFNRTYASLLSGWLNGYEIEMIVDGQECAFNRPSLKGFIIKGPTL